MGMFSEVSASNEAERLKAILVAAERDGEVTLLKFIAKHVYSAYLDAKGEAFETLDSGLDHAMWERYLKG